MKSLIALLATVAAVVVTGTAHADVSQTPIDTGCPAGFEHLSVASLEAAGYSQLPRQLDVAGNNNGFICGLALPEAVRLAFCGSGCPVPVIYLFADDDNQAEQRARAGG